MAGGLLNHAAVEGRAATLFNGSFPSHPTAESVRTLRHLHPEVKIWARDEPSADRLRKTLGRQVGVAPDVAAMMKPVVPEGVVATETDRRQIALVPNLHFAKLGLMSHREVAQAWQDLVVALAREADVTVMPHDIRPSVGDVDFARELTAELQAQRIPVRCFMPRTAAEAKGFLSLMDGCVSARMHAAVAALSEGVPVVGISYLGKFVGQFSFYGAQEHVVEPEAMKSTGELVEALRRAEAARDELKPVTADQFLWVSGLREGRADRGPDRG